MSTATLTERKIMMSDLGGCKRLVVGLNNGLSPRHTVGQSVEYYLDRMAIHKNGLDFMAFSRGVRLDAKTRIADGVDLIRLEQLEPWQFVKVHPTELIVVGFDDEADLYRRVQGEMALFRGYRDREQGLVFVARFGREEEVVSLCWRLRERPLKIGDRLILQRGNLVYNP